MADKSILIIMLSFFIIVIGFMLYIPINMEISDYQNNKLCHENLGLEFDFMSSKPLYQSIDDQHYNCCIQEVFYNEEDGYYKKEKCSGFERST